MSSDDHPVREVLTKVIQDAAINPAQVKELERFVREDWIIDHDEAKFLFRVNQALGCNEDDCAEWTKFFVTSICRFVVQDLDTPGEIDATEGDWLAEMLETFSVANDSENALILELQNTTTSIGGKLGQRIQSLE